MGFGGDAADEWESPLASPTHGPAPGSNPACVTALRDTRSEAARGCAPAEGLRASHGCLEHRQAAALRLELRLDDLAHQRLAAPAAGRCPAGLGYGSHAGAARPYTTPDFPVGYAPAVTHNHRLSAEFWPSSGSPLENSLMITRFNRQSTSRLQIAEIGDLYTQARDHYWLHTSRTRVQLTHFGHPLLARSGGSSRERIPEPHGCASRGTHEDAHVVARLTPRPKPASARTLSGHTKQR